MTGSQSQPMKTELGEPRTLQLGLRCSGRTRELTGQEAAGPRPGCLGTSVHIGFLSPAGQQPQPRAPRTEVPPSLLLWQSQGGMALKQHGVWDVAPVSCVLQTLQVRVQGPQPH